MRLSTEDGKSVMLVAQVDSGAARSFLPKELATDGLELDEDDLTEDKHGARGVEDTPFPTWSSKKPLTGQIIRIDPQNQQAEPWGPEFTLNPAFAEKDAMLLGRADFFQRFEIRFACPESEPPYFLIEY